MVKKDWKVWEIVTESLGAGAGGVYFGGQFFYWDLDVNLGTGIV